jgi:hypothetical protein
MPMMALKRERERARKIKPDIHCTRCCIRGLIGTWVWVLASQLELELIQTHMTQKPLLWVEVGAHAVRKRPFSDRNWRPYTRGNPA